MELGSRKFLQQALRTGGSSVGVWTVLQFRPGLNSPEEGFTPTVATTGRRGFPKNGRGHWLLGQVLRGNAFRLVCQSWSTADRYFEMSFMGTGRSPWGKCWWFFEEAANKLLTVKPTCDKFARV